MSRAIGDDDTRRLSAATASPTDWFEDLYVEAEAGRATVPWDLGAPSASLVDWFAGRSGAGRSAMVVCCGLGRDAEFVASLGYDTAAFDVSPTAVAACAARHPDSTVRYEVADLLALPAAWRHAFDLVVESWNVQSLPVPLHQAAAAAVASLVAAGGTLFVAGAVGDGTADGPPWPLTRDEIDYFAVDGVRLTSVTTVGADGDRWQAEFARG